MNNKISCPFCGSDDKREVLHSHGYGTETSYYCNKCDGYFSYYIRFVFKNSDQLKDFKGDFMKFYEQNVFVAESYIKYNVKYVFEKDGSREISFDRIEIK